MRAQRYIVVKICTTIVNGKNDYGRLSHTIKQENARFSQPPHSSNPGVLNSITCSNLKSSRALLLFYYPLLLMKFQAFCIAYRHTWVKIYTSFSATIVDQKVNFFRFMAFIVTVYIKSRVLEFLWIKFYISEKVQNIEGSNPI